MEIEIGKHYLLPASHKGEKPVPPATRFYFGVDLEVVVVGEGHQNPGEPRYYELRDVTTPAHSNIGAFWRVAADLRPMP